MLHGQTGHGCFAELGTDSLEVRSEGKVPSGEDALVQAKFLATYWVG